MASPDPLRQLRPRPRPRPRPSLLGGVVLLLAGAAALAGCSPLPVINRLVPDDDHRFTGGIAYGAAPRQQLDVYQPPAGATPVAGQRPLVVFFYGGTWSSGRRADYKFVGQALASRGAVAVVADYRLSPTVRYPVFVQDSARAVKWALDHAAELGADPRRVYVMGHSSGGYDAAMVALDPRWLGEVGASPAQLAGWIGLAGPYDFLPIGDPKARLAFNWPDTAFDTQPVAHASARAPRTLLLAAANDDLVDPQRNSAQLADLLRDDGVEVVTRTFADLNHLTLIGAMAAPLEWLGGPVLPPVLQFIGLPSDPSDKAPR